MTDEPFTLFNEWYAEARTSEINDSNAMALATVDADGRPSVRMVLLKGHGPDGFIFYTNFEGRKAGDLLVQVLHDRLGVGHQPRVAFEPVGQAGPGEDAVGQMFVVAQAVGGAALPGAPDGFHCGDWRGGIGFFHG